jgi:hypothetical protein
MRPAPPITSSAGSLALPGLRETRPHSIRLPDRARGRGEREILWCLSWSSG